MSDLVITRGIYRTRSGNTATIGHYGQNMSKLYCWFGEINGLRHGGDFFMYSAWDNKGRELGGKADFELVERTGDFPDTDKPLGEVRKGWYLTRAGYRAQVSGFGAPPGKRLAASFWMGRVAIEDGTWVICGWDNDGVSVTGESIRDLIRIDDMHPDEPVSHDFHLPGEGLLSPMKTAKQKRGGRKQPPQETAGLSTLTIRLSDDAIAWLKKQAGTGGFATPESVAAMYVEAAYDAAADDLDDDVEVEREE